MLEWLKRQAPHFFNPLKLGIAGIALTILALLGATVASLMTFFIGPFLSVRMQWQFNLVNESILKRILLTALTGIGLFVAYAISFPFVVLGLAISTVIWPVGGVYFAVSRGWENGIVLSLKHARDYLSLLKTLLFHPERIMGEPEREINFPQNNNPRSILDNARNQINYAQSAHQATIETGVEDVLKIWKEKYGNLESRNILTQIKEYQDQLKTKEQNIKTKAAIRFLDRVLNEGSLMTLQRKDGTSLRTIVIWAFSHMQIPENWLPEVTKEDVDNNFIESLYQIQRGYNIDKQNIDDGKSDNNTCFGGSINKLVYGMKTVLKGIEINYMSNTTALLKLQALAKKEINDYIHHASETEKAEISFEDIPAQKQEQLKENIKIVFSNEFKKMPGRDKILTDFFSALPYLTIPITRDTPNASPSPNL
ncbi:MAG: hypothetical protein QM652_00010 [Legionella sp.]|uniref:hypothetical protein n=1 Tax=Legionella sp. TaxID=459 RepID=UPI0039E3CD8A